MSIEKLMTKDSEGISLTKFLNECEIGEQPSRISNNVKEYSPEKLKKIREYFVFKAKPRLKPATKDSIRGISHILEEVDRYIVFLQNYLKLRKVDARTSPGLLLMGEAGLGKTLTARYIATVSKARFIEVNEFPRQDAGWTPQNIRALFQLARKYVEVKNKPIVLFWDELEVVAKERSRLNLAEAATVSALTTQLDGFSGKNPGVIFIAATNYAEYLDRALFRPGRLGHKITYTPPNQKGKMDILQYYVEKKRHQPSIDYKSISFFFNPNDSPAKIEETVEDAYLRTCTKNIRKLSKARITTEDLVNSLIENILGTPRETYLDDKERKEIAIHESGHAILGRLLNLPVQIITVMPHGYSEGKTLSEFEEGGDIIKFKRKQIIQGYGGIVAEKIFKINTGGPEKDLAGVTKIAYELIAKYGIGNKIKDINLIALSDRDEDAIIYPIFSRQDYVNSASEKLREDLEEDLFKILETSEKEALRLLKNYGKKRIEYVAEKIVDKKFVVQKDLDKIMQEAEKIK